MSAQHEAVAPQAPRDVESPPPGLSPRERVEQLRQSAAPDLYTPDLYVPWAHIEQQMQRLAPATEVLQDIAHRQAWNTDLSLALPIPGLLEVIRSILVAPSAVGFADGRELPVEPPRTPERAGRLAKLLLDIGLHKLMPQSAHVEDLLRVGLISMDSRRRGFRRRDAVEAEVRLLLERSVETVANEYGVRVHSLPAWKWPPPVRGRAEAVLALGDVPVAALVTVFQAQSGGRQQRDLSETYPRLQRTLDEIPMSLILVLDGRGVQETPRSVLERLVTSVAACMSRAEAADGALSDAVADAAQSLGMRSATVQAMDTLVASALNSRLDITTRELGSQSEHTLRAFAEYKVSHPRLALELDPVEGRLSWARPDLVQIAQSLRASFNHERAVTLLGHLLGMQSIGTPAESGEELPYVFGDLPSDRVLPPRLLVAGVPAQATPETFRAIARLNRQRGFGGGLAALVTAGGVGQVTAQQQRQMTTSIVTVDPDAMMQIATSISPRDEFVKLVLAQADLTKTNPFNPMGATSGRMFFGRDEEEALVQATLDTNSVALLGGRRIGKTSLLQRVVASLQEAGWAAYYADCQAIGNWRDFAASVGPAWNVDISGDFKPSLVDALLRQLQLRSEHDRPLVIALDEIDSLLSWDDQSHPDRPRETLFRALRAASQQGTAQFIFSGERRIATKLWDPTSPHWNFCRPIEVRQLTRRASESLVEVPLVALGVELGERQRLLDLAWDASSGHPQILQFLGDRVVRSINQRPAAERSYVDSSLIADITTSQEYQRHYVETYWGQATPLERGLTSCIALGDVDREGIRRRLQDNNIRTDEQALSQGLRMLSLYGVIEAAGAPLQFRAKQFPHYLDAIGGTPAIFADISEG